MDACMLFINIQLIYLLGVYNIRRSGQEMKEKKERKESKAISEMTIYLYIWVISDRVDGAPDFNASSLSF